MNANELVLFLTGILIGAGLMRYGISVGIKTVYSIKQDSPLNDKAVPTEQNDTFEQEAEEK